MSRPSGFSIQDIAAEEKRNRKEGTLVWWLLLGDVLMFHFSQSTTCIFDVALTRRVLSNFKISLESTLLSYHV